MKRRNYLMALFMLTIGTANTSNFVTIKGENLMDANGKKLYIVGTNLGNWLNPEGYMFDFKKTNCEWMINDMVCELAGPDFAREDYMGKNDETEGFKQMDKVIDWCRKYDLHLILDMHDCPGGQTGDNIDNGHGYPWLIESEASQQLFCQIWQKIASRYKDEPVILGYELMNEPIATMFSDSLRAALNAKLEPLYKRATKAIREVDLNHIILLGGAQWNGNFEPFCDWKFDDKIMYTCTWAR